MKQCLIYDKSLRFSRAVYGALILLAFFIHNKWIVLVVGVLAILGSMTLKANIPYELHAWFSRKFLKRNVTPTQKELAEVNFVSAATGVLLLIGFVLLQYTKYTNFAWIYILVVTLMIFLACLVGFCVATLLYIFLRKIFIKDNSAVQK